MLTNFEYFDGANGTTVAFSMVHAEIDQGSGLISITIDNVGTYVISEKNIAKETHTDTSDLFECLDGSRYCLEYQEFE